MQAPPKTLQNIDDLITPRPHEVAPCVYFLCDGEDVVYVGKSTSVYERVRNHIRDNEKGGDSAKTFERWFYIRIPPERLDAAEQAWIAFLQPRYNKTPIHSLDHVKRPDSRHCFSWCPACTRSWVQKRAVYEEPRKRILALTSDEAAKMISFTPIEWMKLLDMGAGPRSILVGSKRLWRVDDLESWLSAFETK